MVVAIVSVAIVVVAASVVAVAVVIVAASVVAAVLVVRLVPPAPAAAGGCATSQLKWLQGWTVAQAAQLPELARKGGVVCWWCGRCCWLAWARRWSARTVPP